MKVAVLAGGVGGAKLAHGLSRVLPAEDLTVIVNVGDDFTHLGLRICPDLDTVTYNLAGLDNREAGWGLAGDTFEALGALAKLDGPAWFRLGDRDFATHLRRTALLTEGVCLTEVTARLCKALNVNVTVLPASDDPVPTRVTTDEGVLDFQDYFVRRRCEPRVSSIAFGGIETARPSAAVVAALSEADGIIFAPSNPFVSVEPILALPGIRDLVATRPALAVSPIVGGEAIKGPAAKMMRELGMEVSALGVAGRYAGIIGGFVLDEIDVALLPPVAALGLQVRSAQSIMRTDREREDLARVCRDFLTELRPKAWQGVAERPELVSDREIGD